MSNEGSAGSSPDGVSHRSLSGELRVCAPDRSRVYEFEIHRDEIVHSPHTFIRAIEQRFIFVHG